MNSVPRRIPGFRVTPRGMLAALLLVGAIQPAIVAVRFPIAIAIRDFISWLEKKMHGPITVGPMHWSWQMLIANSIFAVVLFCAFLWAGNGVRKRNSSEG